MKRSGGARRNNAAGDVRAQGELEFSAHRDADPIPYALTLDGELVQLGDGRDSHSVPAAPGTLGAALFEACGGGDVRAASDGWTRACAADLANSFGGAVALPEGNV